jgi:two-component system response regulator MprA
LVDGVSRAPSVLLVDDHADARLGLELVLEAEGYAVTGAETADQALGQLQGGLAPDVVLLDLGLPGMPVRSFRDAMRADARLATIPVVVLSGDGWVREKAELLGASEWLQKPVEIERLLEVVARYASTS